MTWARATSPRSCSATRTTRDRRTGDRRRPSPPITERPRQSRVFHSFSASRCRGRRRRRSATRDFDDGNEEEDDNEDDGERGGVKKGHRSEDPRCRITHRAAVWKKDFDTGVQTAMQLRHLRLSNRRRAVVDREETNATVVMHIALLTISIHLFRTLQNLRPSQQRRRSKSEERGIARARLLTPHPPPHPWLIPNCLAERNCIICVGSANCE